MVDAKQFKKFASDVCILLPAAVQALESACSSLQKTASANAELKQRAEKAEAEKIALNGEKLYKAASAVSKLFGGNITAEQLYSVYNANPNALVDSLYKTASHQVGKTVSGSIGVVRNMNNNNIENNLNKADAASVYMHFRNKR